PTVEEDGRLLPTEVAGQDGPELLLHLVGPPDAAPVAADAGELGGLGVGEVLGVLEQRPPAALEVLGPPLVGEPAQLVPQLTAYLVEGLAHELHKMEWIRAHHGLGSVALRLHALEIGGAEIQRHGA